MRDAEAPALGRIPPLGEGRGPGCATPIGKEGGIALLMVLWIMALLTVIVTEFAYSMRTELNITRNFKEDAQSYYLARAGVERALAELTAAYDYNYLGADGGVVFVKVQPIAAGAERVPATQSVSGQQEKVITPGLETQLGDGVFSFRIIDREGKLDINMLVRNRSILNELLIQAGVKEKETRDTIMDSMQDWVDKDDLHRLNGAEDDYYLTLNPPYRAKNDLFGTVEELLLVKGVTREIFYGTPDKTVEQGGYRGLADFLSVTGSNKVNINTAPQEVLTALGYDQGRMELLQTGAPQPSLPPLLGQFPRGTFRPTTRSDYFTIEAKGSAAGSGGNRVIRADVSRRGGGAQGSVIVSRWDDNYYQR